MSPVQFQVAPLKQSESESESEHYRSVSQISLSHSLIVIMFDFQKLDVYQKAKSFCIEISGLQKSSVFDRTTNDQLRRASFSIMLNIAEDSSRFSNRDRKNFMVIARGSAFECVAILEYLAETKEINQEECNHFAMKLDEISRMLFALIKKLEELQK